MKKNIIHCQHFQQEIEGFSTWLKILGYSESTVYNKPHLLREFMHYLENKNLTDLASVQAIHTGEYITYISHRKNDRRAGGLSTAQINSHIGMLHLFNEYLYHSRGLLMPIEVNYLERINKTDPIILSTYQIKQLYAATANTPLGQRDRAMLSIYYGCGLRKSEGHQLNIEDIHIHKQMIFIKASKNNRQRYVPITKSNLQILEEYIYQARHIFLADGSKETALFISERGDRISKESLYLRLKKLAVIAALDQPIGLHTLRHSKATHLLQSGMSLEKISLFLGHQSLDSTQIYTHIIRLHQEE